MMHLWEYHDIHLLPDSFLRVVDFVALVLWWMFRYLEPSVSTHVDSWI